MFLNNSWYFSFTINALFVLLSSIVVGSNDVTFGLIIFVVVALCYDEDEKS